VFVRQHAFGLSAFAAVVVIALVVAVVLSLQGKGNAPGGTTSLDENVLLMMAAVSPADIKAYLQTLASKPTIAGEPLRESDGGRVFVPSV
jgi:hypothetical protein